jgi:hypothetical protein
MTFNYNNLSLSTANTAGSIVIDGYAYNNDNSNDPDIGSTSLLSNTTSISPTISMNLQ